MRARPSPPWISCLATAALLGACGAADVPDDEPDTAVADVVDTGTSVVLEPEVELIEFLGFVYAEGTASEGFDLDDSANGNGSGCGVDFTAPGADEALVDNNFARLLPIIESTGGQALGELVQNAVNAGELLLMFELSGHETAQPGDAIQMSFGRGQGTPTIGGTGSILPGQTFDIHPELGIAPIGSAVMLDNGWIEGRGFDVRLPLAVFDESIDLTLTDGHILLEPVPGGYRGIVGGGVATAEIADNVLGFDAVPDSLVSGILSALDLFADLGFDSASGECTQLSVTLEFQTVSAYFFADSPQDDDSL